MLTTLLTDADLLAQSVGVGTPNPVQPPGAGERLMTILSWVIWGAVLATITGFIIAAAMLAWQRFQGGGGDAQAKLVGAMIGAALISTAGTIINTVVLG